MAEPWIKWTFLQAVTKVADKILSKIIGVASSTLPQVFVAAIVVGLVQTIGGFVSARAKRTKIMTDFGSILGACMFGALAALMTWLGFMVFLKGGDIGINVFIITLSIVPGALIDVFFFKHSLSYRKWLGIFFAVLAGYSILGWPSLQEIFNLPLWVGLSFIVMLAAAVNQGITQKIKRIDPLVKNFWGGLTTLVLSLIGLWWLGSIDLLTNFSAPMPKLWLASALSGVIAIVMWSANVISYKCGAQIAIKKLVMNGSYLIMAMIVGIVLFGETLTVAKIIGVVIYFIAFVFMDDGNWQYLRSKFV